MMNLREWLDDDLGRQMYNEAFAKPRGRAFSELVDRWNRSIDSVGSRARETLRLEAAIWRLFEAEHEGFVQGMNRIDAHLREGEALAARAAFGDWV